MDWPPLTTRGIQLAFLPEARTISTLSKRRRSSVRSTPTAAGHCLHFDVFSVGDALRTGTRLRAERSSARRLPRVSFLEILFEKPKELCSSFAQQNQPCSRGAFLPPKTTLFTLEFDSESVAMQKMIPFKTSRVVVMAAVVAGVSWLAVSQAASPSGNETQPRVVDPGPPGGRPSDAIVLFDGHDLSQWRGQRSEAPTWKVENGCMETTPTGGIFTKQEFGDCQLHVEWASPSVVKGEGQGRGNSGVYLQGRYEIQVLDSYRNPTYPNGQAGAYYGHFAPLVNVCRQPGQWQSYDIIFHAPKLQPDGKVQVGSFTVLQNGVLIQDHVPVDGRPTTAAPLQGIVAKGPLYLQDHGNPVRFRNVWIRPL